MIDLKPLRAGLLLPLILAACSHSGPTPPAAAATQQAPEHALHALFDRHWEAQAKLNPLEAMVRADAPFAAQIGTASSIQQMADSLALERSALEELSHIDARRLGAADALSYAIFEAERKTAIEGFVYPGELIALDPFDGIVRRFAQTASLPAQSFASARDYEDWLRRSDDFAGSMVQLIVNLREGLRRGYSVPKPVVERVLPLLTLYARDDAQNIFYAPLRKMSGLGAADRTRLAPQLENAVRSKVLPAYAGLLRFLKSEYLPRARSTLALSELPLGTYWYAYRVRRFTDSSSSPARIHALGLAEIERLRARAQSQMSRAGMGGDLASLLESLRHEPRFHFATGDELVGAFRELQPKIAALTPKEFGSVPAEELQVEAFPSDASNEIEPIVYQQADPAHRRRARLSIETTDLVRLPRFSVATSFMREGVPGRHWQTALQHEHKLLPRFRRFGASPAFVEGWALYAASLGEELGAYTDTDDAIGASMDEMHHFALLVVDTGIQLQGWSRQRAIEYLAAQVPISTEDAALEVDRCIAEPGRALAAPFGAQKFRILRARAQERLGTQFDAAAFHAQILDEGAMPLDILETRIDRWLKKSR